jgi:hypothetical protein
VALSPGDSIITPGTNFVVRLEVTTAGAVFDGYEAVVRFDPAVLDFIALSPTSAQQGSYMTGACGTAPFHIFRYAGAGADSVKVTHVILCGGLQLPGPGLLYKLKFHARAQPAVTSVAIRRIRFTNGGLDVQPIETSDAFFWVGNPTDAPHNRPAADFARIRVSPVPCNSSASIWVRSEAAGLQTLSVYDVLGRRVRLLQQVQVGVGTRQVTWDGRSDLGVSVASGSYIISLQAPDQSAATRIVFVK